MMYLIAFYFSSISKVPSLYGELATAIVLITWLHLTGMLVFFGEEIIYVSQQEALIEEHRKRASGWSFLPKAKAPKNED